MKVKLKNYIDCWQYVKDATMNTVGKETGIYPDPVWKRRLLLSEHSPIRKLKISWKWYDLKSWVSVHFVRHKIGIEHWVRTQRSDRTNSNRDEALQGALVEHECEGNAQALIFMGRRRLCAGASLETRQAFQAVKDAVAVKEPELASCIVRECVYRNGFCPEMFPCGFNKTKAFEEELKDYIGIKKDDINDKTNIFKN